MDPGILARWWNVPSALSSGNFHEGDAQQAITHGQMIRLLGLQAVINDGDPLSR